MTRIILVLFLTAVLIHATQSHPLSLFRITRNSAEPERIENAEKDLLVTPEEAAQLLTVPRAFVESRPQAIIIDIAYPGTQEDLLLAETQIFRPLFAYRRQVSKRQRVRKLVEQR